MKNYIDSVNFHELEPQRYWTPPASWDDNRKKTEVQNAIFSGDYIGARKMDGAFYKFVKDEDGNMELLGRSKSVSGDYLNKLDWVPQLHSFFDNLPNGTCLIGEIYFPNNEGSNHVTTIMGCLKERAVARQESGERLHYYIFDVLAFAQNSWYKSNIEDRVALLNEISNGWSSEFVEFAKYYEGAELWEQLQSILAAGGEGIVITKKGTCYQPGKRPARQTFKVKKELQETLDVVILGANPPTRLYTGKEIMSWRLWEDLRTGEKLEGALYKRYSDGDPIEPVTKTYWNGWAGSFIIGLYDLNNKKYIPIGSLSGLTEEMLQNWKSYEGKVAEISGMQLMRDNNGKFTGIRHPRLVNLRLDKNPNECLMEQVQ